MTYRVFITPRALRDLRQIRDYIARRSPLNAAKFLERLIKSFDKVERSPNAFGKAPEAKLVPYDLHQYVVQPYRILYRTVGSQVQILHVRHGAMRRAKPEEFEPEVQ
jgi:addiction module RelE/StbE family toxin